MKKWTVLLIIVLALLVSGCGITTPKSNINIGNNNGVVKNVESVVYDYIKALNKLDWDEVKSYCIIDSEAYIDTLTMQGEIESTVGKLTWHWKIDITDTIVDEPLAEVHFNFNVKIKVTRVSGGYDRFEVTKEDAVFHLKKSAWGIWLIYDSYLHWEEE